MSDQLIDDLSGIKTFPLDRIPSPILADLLRNASEWRIYGHQKIMYHNGQVRMVNLTGEEPNPFLLR